MELLKQRLKSKTYWLAIASVLLGIVQSNPAILGWAGLSGTDAGNVLIAVGILGGLIREFTTGPLAEKSM
jgi:uncharacterized membrane protein